MRSSKILLGALAAALLGASSPTPGWEQMKSLVGAWQGAAEGRPVSVTYALVSNGMSLMENLDGGDGANMITMYAPDGDTILATHYCAAGNQPRIRAKSAAEGKTLNFEFVDVTNVEGSGSEVMRRLVITFVDADRFQQQWTSRGADGKERTSVFRYTRKK